MEVILAILMLLFFFSFYIVGGIGCILWIRSSIKESRAKNAAYRRKNPPPVPPLVK